jgi:hypothetical protein
MTAAGAEAAGTMEAVGMAAVAGMAVAGMWHHRRRHIRSSGTGD